MIGVLDTIQKMSVGASLVLLVLKFARGLDVLDEILLTNFLGFAALFWKAFLERRSREIANGDTPHMPDEAETRARDHEFGYSAVQKGTSA